MYITDLLRELCACVYITDLLRELCACVYITGLLSVVCNHVPDVVCCVLEGSHTLAKSVATSTTGLGMFQNLKRKSTCLGCKALLDNDGTCVMCCVWVGHVCGVLHIGGPGM